MVKTQIPEEGQPTSFFMMYGENSGIKLIEGNIKWPFSRGFYFYIWFYVEDFIYDEMSLLNMYVGDC
jgi:hypothetical protein